MNIKWNLDEGTFATQRSDYKTIELIDEEIAINLRSNSRRSELKTSYLQDVLNLYEKYKSANKSFQLKEHEISDYRNKSSELYSDCADIEKHMSTFYGLKNIRAFTYLAYMSVTSSYEIFKYCGNAVNLMHDNGDASRNYFKLLDEFCIKYFCQDNDLEFISIVMQNPYTHLFEIAKQVYLTKLFVPDVEFYATWILTTEILLYEGQGILDEMKKAEDSYTKSDYHQKNIADVERACNKMEEIIGYLNIEKAASVSQ
ncbi:MAG: hypothetical protein JJE17_00570 [Peptostreptococcaceae bacterium]|nr:hypothetical protein [Peptostreptococcaceae bacterium]